MEGLNKNNQGNESGPGAPLDAAVRRGYSCLRDPAAAVDELYSQLGPDVSGLLFFCAPSFDLKILGQAIKDKFNCPVAGCTTAGEICSPQGYLENSLVGVGFTSSKISMNLVFIPSLQEFVNGKDQSPLTRLSALSEDSQFAFMLIDGLSLLEERVTSIVQHHLGNTPLIGGSAGDGLNFQKTCVYHQGEFYSGAALVSFFKTSLPFQTFRIQHFVPTETKLVITEADVDKRTVQEINGLPAAGEYARIVGVSESELSPEIFARYPLMLRIGGEYFVRSIRKSHPDGSLSFYCAIAKGLVLTLAHGDNLLKNLKARLTEISSDLGPPQLVLGCDCILRRIEVQERSEARELKKILAAYPFSGLGTYGEQYGGVHVNQTLTGLFLGNGE